MNLIKPYAYARWRLCYRIGRNSGYSVIQCFIVSFWAMQHIEIYVSKREPPEVTQ